MVGICLFEIIESIPLYENIKLFRDKWDFSKIGHAFYMISNKGITYS